MVFYERNIDIEAIDTDSFLGIKLLSNQSIGQKLIFWGSVVLSVSAVSALYFLGIPAIVYILVMIAILGVGVLFGTNYNDYLSLFQYAKGQFQKKVVTFESHPVSDVRRIRREGKVLRSMDEKMLKDASGFDKKASRRMLLAGAAFIVAALIALFAMIAIKRQMDAPRPAIHTEIEEQ